MCACMRACLCDCVTVLCVCVCVGGWVTRLQFDLIVPRACDDTDKMTRFIH